MRSSRRRSRATSAAKLLLSSVKKPQPRAIPSIEKRELGILAVRAHRLLVVLHPLALVDDLQCWVHLGHRRREIHLLLADNLGDTGEGPNARLAKCIPPTSALSMSDSFDRVPPLPDDVVLLIMGFLPGDALATAMFASKRWYTLAMQEIARCRFNIISKPAWFQKVRPSCRSSTIYRCHVSHDHAYTC